MLKHLACIMDGNRRWAVEKGMFAAQGHKKGFDAIRVAIEFCLDHNIEHLSLYAFSAENIRRPEQEISYLFEVLAFEAAEELIELKEKNIKISFVGDRTIFPKNIRSLCEKIEQETKACTGLYLHILLFYGSRQEIADTARRIAIKVQKGDLLESDITVDVFERFLWTATIPNPDLIIRTGGDRRLSNFLLFQAAYSEIYFLDCLWPDIQIQHLKEAATYFNTCRKNFGS